VNVAVQHCAKQGQKGVKNQFLHKSFLFRLE
jgi:hypothetical protein